MRIGWLIAAVSLLAAQLPSQTPAQHGLALAQDNLTFLFPLSGHMRWTGSRLAGCDFCESNHPILWAVDRQGVRSAVAFNITGAGYTNVRDVAAGPDGSLSAVGLAISGDSRMTTFIAWLSPDGTRQILTQAWPYSPQVATVAADGTIWTMGAMMNDNHRVVYPNVLRHYTQSGQLLASTFVQGVRKSSTGLYNVSAASALMASNDRIGWLTQTCQYIEFSFDAVQLGSYACPNGYTSIADVSGVALSSANDLLVGGKWLAPLAPLELDRAASTWTPVTVLQDSGKTQMLLGFDGLTLVTSAKSSLPSFMRRYSWSDAMPPAGQ
jgi:hypothetical protein